MEMAATNVKGSLYDLYEHAMELAREQWPEKPRAFESVPDVAGRPWYIIQANPQQEGIACSHLLARGFEAYLPMERVEGVRAGRSIRTVHRAMFPGYLFLRMLFGIEYDRARNLPGVRGIMQKPGGGFPNPTEADIAFIKSQEKEALDPKSYKAEKIAPFSLKRMVRIKDGPFGGFTGPVWRLAEHERITLLLHVFGRPTSVTFAPEQLEPL